MKTLKFKNTAKGQKAKAIAKAMAKSMENSNCGGIEIERLLQSFHHRNIRIMKTGQHE